MDLVRLAIPRRTYTQSHIDYVIEVVARVAARAGELRGLRIVSEPPALRHFTATFEPLCGDDFHAHALLLGGGQRVLDGEHGLHRGDGDGELVEVGLARRQQLQLHARPHDRPDPPVAAVLAGELDHLERDAGDQRHAEDAREHQQVPGRQPDRREDEDRHDHHDEQEARAAARVQAREALRGLGARAAGRPRSRRSSCARRRGTRRRGAGRASARAARGSRGRSRCARRPRRARRGTTSRAGP